MLRGTNAKGTNAHLRKSTVSCENLRLLSRRRASFCENQFGEVLRGQPVGVDGAGGNLPFILGRDMGGCKTYGGRKTYQRTPSPENVWTPPKELLGCSVVEIFVQGKTEH